MQRNGGWVAALAGVGDAQSRRLRFSLRTQLVGSDADADIVIERPGFPKFACGFRLEHGRPWFHRFAGAARIGGRTVDSTELCNGDEVTLDGVSFVIFQHRLRFGRHEETAADPGGVAIDTVANRALHL